MCVPPIMLTALSTSVAKLINNPAAARYFRRMVVVFLIGMVAAAAVGVAGMVIARPGAGLSQQAQLLIGNMLRDAHTVGSSGATWAEVLFGLIPQNMFAAIAEGNYPQILFISLLLGLLLGVVRLPATERMLELAELVFELFQQAIMWSTYFLPVAVIGIVAGQVATAGVDLLLALGRLLAACFVVAFFIWLVSSVLLAKATGVSWREQERIMRRPLAFAFATANSMATMPILMETLEQLRLPRQLVNIVLPLGVLLARYAFVNYGAMALVFAMQLYGLPVTPGALAAIIAGSAFVGAATTGMPAVPFMTALTIVSVPLGIPLEAVIPIFLAILPIFDPFGTAAAVQLQAATTAIIVGQEREMALGAPGTGTRFPTQQVSSS